MFISTYLNTLMFISGTIGSNKKNPIRFDHNILIITIKTILISSDKIRKEKIIYKKYSDLINILEMF